MNVACFKSNKKAFPSLPSHTTKNKNAISPPHGLLKFHDGHVVPSIEGFSEDEMQIISQVVMCKTCHWSIPRNKLISFSPLKCSC